MSKKCIACNTVFGSNTIFYIWSSSRNFPINKLMKITNRNGRRDYKNFKEGREVCQLCYERLMNEE